MRVIPAGVLALCLAAPTSAGSITGRVSVPAVRSEAPSFRPYAGRASSLPAPKRPARGLVTDVVLYVETVPAGVRASVPKSHPQLAQRGQSFDPRVVVVPVGGSVEFPNFDPIYHNVFSVSPSRRFDLGKYPSGQSRTVQFPRSGVVNVFCDIHSDMAAFIFVTPTAAWARPGNDGRFELGALPEGRYRMRWWHPDLGEGTADVEVPAAGAVTLDVRL